MRDLGFLIEIKRYDLDIYTFIFSYLLLSFPSMCKPIYLLANSKPQRMFSSIVATLLQDSEEHSKITIYLDLTIQIWVQ